MGLVSIFFLIVVVLCLGIVLGRVASKLFYGYEEEQSYKKAMRIVKEAKSEAARIKRAKVLETRERLARLRSEFEQSVGKRRAKLITQEHHLESKTKEINQQVAQLHRKQVVLERAKNHFDQLSIQRAEQLGKVAHLSVEAATQQLMESLEDKARSDAALRIRAIVNEAQAKAAEKAKSVILSTIQRTAAAQTIEHCASVINIEEETLKGKIIGREGRNIRALEAATGVDITVDEMPKTILLSSFDPVRREVARIALQALIKDGRIHPARIEEVVAKTENTIEQEIRDLGERTVLDLNIYGMHVALIRLIGKMRYRASYGQNLLLHSREVAQLTATMAAEMGLNSQLAKRAGLLHDIGKVITEKPELSHAILGMELAEKHREHPEVCNAIGAHHDEIEMRSMLAPIVQACDAISGARPGVRRESSAVYVKRLRGMEDIALSFKGVQKCYAIQAGKELRVMVDATRISDELARTLSLDISGKIEQQLQYPGQVRVTVIRETRAISYAK